MCSSGTARSQGELLKYNLLVQIRHREANLVEKELSCSAQIGNELSRDSSDWQLVSDRLGGQV